MHGCASNISSRLLCILVIVRLKHGNPSFHDFFFLHTIEGFQTFRGYGHVVSLSCRNQSPLHHSPTTWFCQVSELTTFEHVNGTTKDAATKTRRHVHFTNEMAHKRVLHIQHQLSHQHLVNKEFPAKLKVQSPKALTLTISWPIQG